MNKIHYIEGGIIGLLLLGLAFYIYVHNSSFENTFQLWSKDVVAIEALTVEDIQDKKGAEQFLSYIKETEKSGLSLFKSLIQAHGSLISAMVLLSVLQFVVLIRIYRATKPQKTYN